jgi:hypothetical protein
VNLQRLVSLPVSLLLLSVVFACGDGTRPPTAPSASSLSGAWQGTLASPINPLGNTDPLFTESSPVTFELTQNGLQVSGTLRIAQDDAPDLVGTITGTLTSGAFPSRLDYVATYGIADGQCKATFSGVLNVSARELVGSVHGQNCVREFGGTLSALKST